MVRQALTKIRAVRFLGLFEYVLKPPYSLPRKGAILGTFGLIALLISGQLFWIPNFVQAAPSTPGTPTTTSPNPSSTPTWTWTASTGGGAGLGDPPYQVRWSQTSDFSSGVSTDTASTNSYTHTTSLANGTWYFQVRAVDNLAATSSYSSTGSVYINSNTITGADSYSGEPSTQIAINDLQITGVGNPTVPVKLRVTSGTLSMTTTTGLTFTGSSSGSTLYFSGTLSNVNAALATLRYTKSSSGSDTIEVSLVDYGEVFFEGTGHLYEYVTSTLTWTGARDAAVLRNKYGATGYLTTITSAEENSFVSARLLGAGWMGAGDMATEGDWKWVTGPESGTSFWSGNGSGSTVSGRYANWNTGEPNDAGGNEDCGQFLAGGTGKWNDLPCSGTTLAGYVVEYGAPGNMPLVASKNISVTVADFTPPTNPGTPAGPSSPTTDNTPTWTWTASSDAGVGLASPAYTVQFSQTSDFSSGVTSATTSSATYTPSTLSDGTWYFRVKASDLNGNASAWATSSALVVDATAPTVPGIPSAPSPTNDTTPTWTWTASSDAGVGLAATPYSVQWSQSSTFASGINSGTATGATFTVPTDLAEGTWYFRVLATDSLGQNSSYSSIGSVVVDTTQTALSEIAAASTSNTEQIVTWETDEDSSSQIFYGPSSAYGSQTTITQNSPLVASHSVALTGLVACTNYHYQVSSVDAAGNQTVSDDANFTTSGCAGTAAVLNQTAQAAPHSTGIELGLLDGSKGIRVSAPANFTTVDTVMQIKKIDPVAALSSIGKPTASFMTVGDYVYDIKTLQNADTAVTSFDAPVTVSLTYTDDEIQGLDEQSLVIYRWDDGPGWQALSDCQVNTSTKTVTCTTPGFSTFALFGSEPVEEVVTPTPTPTPVITPEPTATPAPVLTTKKKNTQVAIATTEATPTPVATVEPTPTARPTPTITASADPTTQPSGENDSNSGHTRYYVVWIVIILLMGWFLLAWKRRRKDDDTEHPPATIN